MRPAALATVARAPAPAEARAAPQLEIAPVRARTWPAPAELAAWDALERSDPAVAARLRAWRAAGGPPWGRLLEAEQRAWLEGDASALPRAVGRLAGARYAFAARVWDAGRHRLERTLGAHPIVALDSWAELTPAGREAVLAAVDATGDWWANAVPAELDRAWRHPLWRAALEAARAELAGGSRLPEWIR